MMFKVQFEFTDNRLLIALTTQLSYYGGRYGSDEYDGKVCDEMLSVLNEYKDCIKGFEVVKGIKESRINYCTFEGTEGDGEECYVELWVNDNELKYIIQ